MPRRKRPVLGIDYIIDTDGRAQFTREYLLKLGTCCGNQCRYCPYENKCNAEAETAAPAAAAAAVGHSARVQAVSGK
ncbi:DUF5522 domain-containing protein [Fontivita pretiosa]|uniref:DUF5522 domain-containing protein n=1 Tax=Fontivita pretiosa TaxID=2989684 RepID=UPI003D16261F